MTTKRWGIMFIILSSIGLMALGLPTVIIDPYFHYHAPLKELEYPLNNQRYQNDGIMRHFEYDAVIIGTSMTENFKTSEFDTTFNVTSIKVPFAGASYKEINENLLRAVQRNSDIHCVVRGLDYNCILDDKDRMRHESYPMYLYNDDLADDVFYIFNKEILCDSTYSVINYSQLGNHTPNFDEYSSWDQPSGEEVVLSVYERPEKVAEKQKMSREEYKKIEDNLMQNVLSLAIQNPQVDFYLFWTPYSIVYWDSLNQENSIEKQLLIEKYASQLLMGYQNIHLFSFYDDFELICNLDNYKDPGHYISHVNSTILQSMFNGTHELTRENYDTYYDVVYDFYMNYDYDAIF